ncbi:MAG: hypothetical protein E7081_05440 [Bacteroidales bacterium]|nr:hypothetical protein [Bacteroidales bacterium]
MTMTKRLAILLLAFLSMSVVLADKTQRSIKQEQQRTKKEIKQTEKKIAGIKKDTRRQLSLLNNISTEIKENTKTINKLKSSIDSIDISISKLNDSIKFMESRVATLRKEYGEMLQSIRIARHSTSDLAFIFSSKSFADAYRRIRYLKQFTAWQNNKTLELKEGIATVNRAKTELMELHNDRVNSIKQVSAAQLTLQNNEKKQTQVIDNLNKERASLEAYMKQKQNEARKLDDQLNQLIAQQKKEAERKRREAEKRRKEEEKRKKEKEKALAEKRRKEQEQKSRQEEAQNRQPSKPIQEELAYEEPAKQSEFDADAILSGKFEENKGRLPYPLSGSYRIVGRFGRQKHPHLKYIETENNGIDIELLSSGNAKAIFDGTVSAIFTQTGYNNIVMVRHGEYITIYANLSTLNVKTGDKVKINQSLGNVYADPDDDNRRILHFEIRKETQKLNPQLWIK